MKTIFKTHKTDSETCTCRQALLAVFLESRSSSPRVYVPTSSPLNTPHHTFSSIYIERIVRTQALLELESLKSALGGAEKGAAEAERALERERQRAMLRDAKVGAHGRTPGWGGVRGCGSARHQGAAGGAPECVLA